MDGRGRIKVRNDFLLSTNRPHRYDSICNFARANLNINISSYRLYHTVQSQSKEGTASANLHVQVLAIGHRHPVGVLIDTMSLLLFLNNFRHSTIYILDHHLVRMNSENINIGYCTSGTRSHPKNVFHPWVELHNSGLPVT
jgi:hypothetical protein